MGCKGSKGTNVESKNKPDERLTVEEAEAKLVADLTLPEDLAKKVVEKFKKDDNNKVSKNDLDTFIADVKKTREELIAKFAEADKDDTGYVTKEEAAGIIQQVLPDYPESGVSALIAAFAGDDEKMNTKEFAFFYAHLKARHVYLEEKFQELDSGDGTVAADDVVKCLTDAVVIEEKTADALVRNQDFNKDGRINKEEFKGIWMKLMAAA